MKNFILIALACVVLVGCGWPDAEMEKSLRISTPKNQALDVRIVSDPAQAERMRKLEERVEAVERHLQRQGARFK